jgi:hypothetical protein
MDKICKIHTYISRGDKKGSGKYLIYGARGMSWKKQTRILTRPTA